MPSSVFVCVVKYNKQTICARKSRKNNVIMLLLNWFDNCLDVINIIRICHTHFDTSLSSTHENMYRNTRSVKKKKKKKIRHTIHSGKVEVTHDSFSILPSSCRDIKYFREDRLWHLTERSRRSGKREGTIGTTILSLPYPTRSNSPVKLRATPETKLKMKKQRRRRCSKVERARSDLESFPHRGSTFSKTLG